MHTRLEQVTSSAAIDVVWWSQDATSGSLLAISPSSETVFGHTAEAILRDPALLERAVHPSDRSILHSLVSRLRTGERSARGIFRVTGIDGAVQWVCCHAIAVSDRCHQSANRIESLAWSITYEPPTASLDCDRTEVYQALVMYGSSVYAVTDAKGCVVYHSPSLERVYGWKPEDLSRKQILECMHPEDRLHASELYRELTTVPGSEKTMAVRFEHRDGSWRTAIISGINLLEHPHVRGVVWTSQDITERRHMREALRESEARHRAVVEQSTDGIFLVDVESRRIIEANASLRRLLGYSPEEITQLTLYDVLAHPRAEVDEQIREILRENRSFPGERKYRCKDGSLVDAEVNANAISYQGLTALCVVTRDITQRKRAEQALKKAHDELDRRVKERTEQLAEANRQLTIEREALRRKNIALRELLSQIGQEKRRMACQMRSNIEGIMAPLLARLETVTDVHGREQIEIVRHSLENVVSPFLNQLEQRFSSLTPREIEICSFVRKGYTSKQIAAVLHRSEQTILKQRKIIRRKLKLSNRSTNLASYLKTLDRPAPSG